jgi:hypothetical protein
MESWPEQENWVQMMLAVPRAASTQLLELPAKQTQRQRALVASQLAEPRHVSEKRPEQAKLAGLETAPVV